MSAAGGMRNEKCRIKNDSQPVAGMENVKLEMKNETGYM